MKAEAQATPAEKAGTSMSLKARADVLEQGFFDEKAEWNYARNVEVRRPMHAQLPAKCSRIRLCMTLRQLVPSRMLRRGIAASRRPMFAVSQDS